MIIRNTPAFTIVEEWRNAEVGVGATIAPRSQPEKGIIADLVKPQSRRSARITVTGIPANASPTRWESAVLW